MTKNNNRVLAFSLDASDNLVSSTALFVLGQTNFVSNGATTTQNGLNSPQGLSYDVINARLFVSDYTNNRVMAFSVPANATSGISGENATFVLGQTNFTAAVATTTQKGLNGPQGLFYDPGSTRLFVVDYTNCRVMAFGVPANATSGVNGENAIFELGQSDFLTVNYLTTQNGLIGPHDVGYDASNGRLFVIDGQNSRVMAFGVPANATSGVNGENAIFELGQPDFLTVNYLTTQNGLNGPVGLSYDASATRLFVSDSNNSRVMAFGVPANATSGVNGENAIFVLGQPDFLTANYLTTQNGLSVPAGLSYNATTTRLFVSDSSNNRVMAFSVPANATSGVNGENASAAIGHYDPTGVITSFINSNTDAGYLTNAQGISGAASGAVDAINHRLFVGDANNNRILVFPLDANNRITTTTASYVLGQPDFTSNVATTTRSGMQDIHFLDYDSTNQRLFAADSHHARVLVFNVATSTIHNGEDADHVLGQPDFTSGTGIAGQNGFHQPDDMGFDQANQRLFVTDVFGDRILVFNVAPGSIHDGENADHVLGQKNFASSTAGTTSSTLNINGGGLPYDPNNQRLFASDYYNNRILVFNVATSTIHDGEGADWVLGQTIFTVSTAGTAQNKLRTPADAAYDETRDLLYAFDNGNNRVVVYNVATSTMSNGKNALAVIGQPNFNTSSTGASQSGINGDGSVFFDPLSNQMFLPEFLNNRLDQFSFVRITTASLPSSTVGVAYSQAINTTSSQATTTFLLISGKLPTGLTLSTTTGIIAGTTTVATTTTFTVEVDDTFSDGSIFLDRHTFTLESDLTVQFSQATTTVGETSSSIQVVLSLAATSSATTSAAFSVTGNATSGIDYALSSTTVTFSPGATTSSVTFTPLTDSVYGPPKILTLTLTTSTNSFLIGAQATSTITILESDAPPVLQLVATSSSGAAGTSTVPVSVSLNTTSSISAAATYAATGGTAVNGTDFSFASGTATIDAGATSTSFNLSIFNVASTSARTIVITLSNPASSTLGANTTYTYTINATTTPATPPASGGGIFVGVAASYAPPLPVVPTPASTTTVSPTSSLIAQLQSLYLTLQALEQAAGMAITPMPTWLGGNVASTGAPVPSVFSRDLTLWDHGADVRALQALLIAQATGPAAQRLKAHGVTTVFGMLTYHALVELQHHAGIMPASGYFGAKTRAWVDARNQ